MTALAPDLDQAQRFLTMIDEEAPAFTFQTATDAEPKPTRSPRPGDQSPARQPKGARRPQWQRRGRMGHGQRGRRRRCEGKRTSRECVPCSPTSTARRCAGHGVRARAALRGREQPRPFPRVLAVENLLLDQFEGVQRRIATMFGGDHVTDLCRVMRLPGFMHQKDPTKPFMVRIVHQDERLPYPAADILRVFPPLEREQGKADNGAGEAIDLPHQPPEPLSHARLAALKESHGHLFDLDRYGGTIRS